MRAGQMDRRVTLKHRVAGTQDGNGSFPDETWTAYDTVWARKIEVSAREYFAAAQTQAESTVRFEIRHRTDVLATDRLVCEGVDYEITAPPAEIGRREGLTIFARAIASG
jgi:SPP1 family predicted phage head-tail adaptor